MNIHSPVARVARKRYETVVLNTDGSTFTTYTDSPAEVLVYPKFHETLSSLQKKDRFHRIRAACYRQEKHETRATLIQEVVLQDKNIDILEQIKRK